MNQQSGTLALQASQERREKKTRKLNWIIADKFYNLEKEIDIIVPGSTESPKQDESKEVHTKTHDKAGPWTTQKHLHVNTSFIQNSTRFSLVISYFLQL